MIDRGDPPPMVQDFGTLERYETILQQADPSVLEQKNVADLRQDMAVLLGTDLLLVKTKLQKNAVKWFMSFTLRKLIATKLLSGEYVLPTW